MKMRSRLTALVLAVLMLISTAAPALAADALPLSVYQSMVDSAADQATSQPVIDEGGQVYDLGDTAQPVASGYDTTVEVTLAAGEGEQTVALPVNGKVLLTADIAAGQWQVQVGDQWVNMHGETDSTIEVTFAKVQSLFVMNNAAKLRFISADGSAVSNVANVGLDYSVQTLEEDVAMPMMYKARALNANAGIALAAEGEETQTQDVTVVVKYIIQTETGPVEVANPYVANLGKNGGALYTAEMSLPTVEGYKPGSISPETGVKFKQAEEDEDGNITTSGSFMFELESVTVPVQYVVTYVPAKVDFTVNHRLMAFDGVLSSSKIDKIDTHRAYTGTPVGKKLELTYDGFYPLWYDDTTKIAADGSTVVNIYYERNWYLMAFDLGEGGYGVDPIYAQYGAQIEVGTPTRPGYSFVGWVVDPESEEKEYVDLTSATMPAENTTYYADWKQVDLANVSVVLWGENANDEDYSYESTIVIQVRPGTELNYETTLTDCGFSAHSHNDECYKCGSEEHEHVEACYKNCEYVPHPHTRECYTISNGTLSTSKETDTNWLNAINNATPYANGVYRVQRRTMMGTSTRYYLKIDDSYYRIQGVDSENQAMQITVSTDNCTDVHVHTESCISCNKAEHNHSDACGLKCTLTEHSHVENCYTEILMDTDLWTLVKADTVTVKPDGSSVINVYYDRTEKTLTFKYDYSSSRYNKTDSITAKWGEKISDEYIAIAEDANSTFWSAETDGSSPYTNYFGVMPEKDATYYNRGELGTDANMTYYGESLTGEYKVMFTVGGVGGFTVTDEDRYAFEGFTYSHGTANNASCNGATFYYTRNRYTLVLNNGEENEFVFTSNTSDPDYATADGPGVLFEANLAEYEAYEPTLPSFYEEGSRRFAGWYLNPECSGEPVILSEETMPADNVILYARWDLVVHKVTINIVNTIGNVTQTIKVMDEVKHYSTIDESNFPSNDQMEKDAASYGYANYSFVGWFYKDENGKEMAFAPGTMPITKDLDIYAKWSAIDPIAFTIYYKLLDPETGKAALDENGQEIHVAPKMESQALDGTSITVNAKVGNDLYEEYRTGYFPKPPSHTVEVTVQSNTSFTFWYLPADKVPYRVVHLEVDQFPDKDGENFNVIRKLSEETFANNSATIVTAQYERQSGLVPDAYQKRLIVAYPGTIDDKNPDGEEPNNWTDPELGENIIFFYYVRDTVNALWTVTHYVEPIGGSTNLNDYEMYGDPKSQTGAIGAKQKADWLTIPGFTKETAFVDVYTAGDDTPEVKEFAENEALEQVLTDGGIEFRLYYTRNQYPVKVQHLEHGTNKELAATVLHNEGTEENPILLFDYQSQVFVSTDKTFAGYKLASEMDQDLIIRVDDDANIDDLSDLSSVTKNVITFYYKKLEVEINYVGVAPDGTLITTAEQKQTIGSVTPEAEPGDTDGVVTALDGPVVGSTATAASTVYKFAGWYLDEACTKPVPAVWVNGNKIVPQKQKLDGDESTAPLYESATYYAKFENNVATLTIKKTGMNDYETAVFLVTAVTEDSTEAKTFYVSVPNGKSVTIDKVVIGTGYSVVEQGDWTWRYSSTATNASGTIAATGSVAEFTNTQNQTKWLDDENLEHNVFGTPNNQ